MEKYKICPSCGVKNDPVLLECLNCEADLTRVKILDQETEAMLQEQAEEKAGEQEKYIRVCECGTKNKPNARKCSSCNEDISDITPTVDTEEEQTVKTYIFSSLDGKYAYKVSSEKVTIGRENVMGEYLLTKSYVSREHAEISIVEDELFIENLSGTNFTFVNNDKITEKTKLNEGDEIGLGGTNVNGVCQDQAAYFLVRIE